MHVSKRTALGAAAIATVAFAIPTLADPGHPAGGSSSTACNDGTVTWNPTQIWPPNHKETPFTVNYSENGGDGDNDQLTIQIMGVTHNQFAQDGTEDVGAGHTETDWGYDPAPHSAPDTGTATTTGWVRSERSGKDGARTYTITVQCTDSGGTVDVNDPAEGPNMMQTETVDLTITVPHDQGHRS